MYNSRTTRWKTCIGQGIEKGQGVSPHQSIPFSRNLFHMVQKPIKGETSFRMELGGQQEGTLMPCHSLSITDLTGSDGPCICILFYYPSRRKNIFAPSLAIVQPMRDSQLSQ